jgi:hypothetical protein
MQQLATQITEGAVGTAPQKLRKLPTKITKNPINIKVSMLPLRFIFKENRSGKNDGFNRL